MELKVESQINVKELYSFLVHHTYSSAWGFTGIIISICAILAFIQMCIQGGNLLTMLFLLITAMLFLVIQPLRLYLQAVRYMESDEGYQSPIRFCLNQSGIQLEQGDAAVLYSWNEVTKVTATSKVIAFYINKTKVVKIARRDVEEEYDMLKKIVRTFCVQAIVKMK